MDYHFHNENEDEEMILHVLRELSKKDSLSETSENIKDPLEKMIDLEIDETKEDNFIPDEIRHFIGKNTPWINLNNQIHKDEVLDQIALARDGKFILSDDGYEIYEIDSEGEVIRRLVTQKGLKKMQEGLEISKGDDEDSRLERDLKLIKRYHDNQESFPDSLNPASDKQAFFLKKRIEDRWPGKPTVRINLNKCHKGMMSDIIDILSMGSLGFKQWEDYVGFLAKNGVIKIIEI